MLRPRIAGLTIVLGIAACAHRTAPVAPPPSPAQGSDAASVSSTDNAAFGAADASMRTFLHRTSASHERRFTATYEDSDIHTVLAAFAAFSNRTIIAGHEVAGTVTVEVHNLPWDVALQGILVQQGLVASEAPDGTITVTRD
jgi:hypothetical protein